MTDLRDEAIARTLEAVASPIRLKILRLLAIRPQHRSFLLEELGCSRQAASRHISMLEAAGLITTRPEPRWRVYRLQGDWIALLEAWLATYRRRFPVDSDKIASV